MGNCSPISVMMAVIMAAHAAFLLPLALGVAPDFSLEEVKQLKRENEFLRAENKELRAQNFQLEKKENARAAQGPATMPPKIVSCKEQKSCQTCVGSSTCGWCYGANQCQDGSIKGPTAQNCSIWGYAFCQGESCSKYDTCDTCVGDPFCGWCKSALACVEGTDVGPLVGKCKQWEHSKCGSADHTVADDGSDVQSMASHSFSMGKSAFKQIRMNMIHR